MIRAIMGDSRRSEIDSYHLQLAKYKSIAAKYKHVKDKNPLLYQQVEFWIESARFCITELEIWKNLGDEAKYNETLSKAQEILERLQNFTTRLIEEAHPGIPKKDHRQD